MDTMSELAITCIAILVDIDSIRLTFSRNKIRTNASLQINLRQDTKRKAASDSILIFCRLLTLVKMVSYMRVRGSM